jgi:hypothetical protein
MYDQVEVARIHVRKQGRDPAFRFFRLDRPGEVSARQTTR